ncbi:unnamed protein product [Hyaloperonospora brassicae]|uniref:Poly [ADP-ribose] polymerase n=1 Tax=Hyaloperonospora brassicae TaxID=162125 RepID=A0AAV0U0M7_HYABA|nr:unnamed protein product [Hyaloperonospora brassicae]
MTALAKRKWTAPDWDVAMAAHSFVAVLASRPDQERAGERLPKKTPTNARATKPRHAQTDDDGTLEATKDVATCTFWLAQLQDDVTEDMLAAHDETSVRVTWLQHTAQRRYVVTYDDCVDVASILCQVRLCEPTASTLEMTAKSLLRVQRCLARSRAARAGQPVAAEEDDDDDDDDDERLRPSLSLDSRNRRRAAVHRRTTSSAKRVKIEGRTPRDRGGSLLLPVLRAEVDEAAYEDLEVLGTQPFRSFRGDVASANREVVRAVLTKNLKLLETLTTSAHVYAELSTFDAPRSADVARTALHYAIDHDDLAAVVLLHRTKTIDAQKFAAAPEVALPSHSTGRHTSQYSAYDRRAVNASRGGKEGNNALLGDCTSDRTPSLDYLWRSPDTSVEMFTLMYPVGDWTKGYDMGTKVCQAARCGNFRLVRKVVETLEKNGGWGFNELHYRVLADCTANNHGGHASLLPPFRAVSALKQASQTRLRPLHLACINPNSKFLAALWDVVGDEFGAVKDDQGYEPIHYAAVCEFAAPMEFLLERRCNMLGRTKTRLTPLMCALEAGREETAIALLEFAVRLRESGGESQEVVGKLVREKGPGGKQAVHFAARHGCVKVLEYLLRECGCAVEVNATSNGTSKATPLVLAAQEGHIECVRVLLANGARVDSGDKLKKTPLILAVKNGHTRVAAVLINGGANVNAYDSSGNSVAHYAASYGWPSCLQMLCDVGAELWSQNAWGFLPLACAMLKQRRSCAEIILAQISCAAHQASLNFRDREGRTVLFSHCQHSHNLEQLGYLLGKGMNPNIGDSNGEYPLQRLIKRACDDAPQDEDINVVFRKSAASFVEAIKLLLQYGAHPQYELYHERVKDTETFETPIMQPLQIAMLGKQVDIVALLLEHSSIRPAARSSDGSDAWITAASLGAGTGDSFLSMLLTHHNNLTNGGPLLLEGKSERERENFFHVVANQKASQLSARSDLIRECADKCPSTSELMCEKDSAGYTPVMRLLYPSHELNAISCPAVIETNFDKLQYMRNVATRLTQLFKIYAEMSTRRENFVRCEEVSRLLVRTGYVCAAKENNYVGNKNGPVERSNSETVSVSGSSHGSTAYLGDKTRSDSNSSNSTDDRIAPIRHLSTFGTISKDEAKQKVMVEVETAMHFIARQKQLGEVANSRSKSLDCTDQTTECLMDVLLEKRPELFSSSRGHQVNALVNFVDLCSYKTALHYAVEMGNEPTVRVLLEHQADANLSPVRCANCSEFAVADAVARAKQDTFVSRDTNLSCTGHCGLHTRVEPALYESVKRRHVKCTRLLLKHGARVDCVGRLLHESPLHVALKANDCASAGALLSHGASLLTQDISGASPLHLAVAAKHSVPAKKANVSEVAYSTVSIAQLLPAGRPVSAKAAQFSVTLSTDANEPHKQQASMETSAILIALNNANAHKAVVLGDSKNRSIVHYAARNRDLDLLRELLRTAGESGVRDAVNQRDYLGRTPLHYAVNAAAMSADASFAVERFLLQSGAISSTQDCFGFGVLHFALVKVQLDWQEKHEKMHKLLRDQKDRVGHSFGAEKHEVEKAFLVEHLSVIPDRETDPVETVSNLVAECNLDIMAQDILGRSPLHLSAATGAFVCVSTLLTFLGNASKQKVCMAQQDCDGFTPLGQAILHKRQTTIMTLLRSGSTVGGTIRIARQPVIFRDGFASCPLVSSSKGESMVKTRSYFHHAVRNGLTGVCHMLLSAHFCRRQAIEDSVRCSQFQLANNLLEALVSGSEHGSELLRRPNSRGETLLHSLAKTKQTVFCTLAKKLAWALLGAGVRVDDRDKMGNIAMHYAAKRGNTHLMDFLRHHSVGANTENVKNRAGETPLVYAFKQKSTSGSSSDDQLFAVLCYFLEHPLLALDINHADNCGVNVISAFLDRFTESLAVAKPVLYFTMFETLLARGADPNQRFHVAHATALEQWNDSCGELYEGSDRLLRSGRKLRETTTLAKGGMGTMPPLIRVALTPDASIRFHALALLLRYGAKLSACDGKGNTVLMHLVARNLVAETRLVLGLVRSVPDPKDMFALAPVTRMCSLHIPEAIVKEMLGQRNANGLTACHIAVQPLDYGSYENTNLLAMLIRAGGDLHAKDSSGQDAIDYTRSQRSCFVSRFLQRTYPEVVSMTQARKIEIATEFAVALPYVDDANAYLAGCKLSGKIKQSHVLAKVNANCNVGKESKVCREGEGRGIALDALLTKVDVRSGRFGSNVFYRLQLVHDELQTIFVLFTNWGRIGETGKFQNTPFRDEAEARGEFKKIFRSKTGNTWESRTAGNFVKKPKKYNLIERVNYSAQVDDEVTRSFRADMEDKGRKRPVFVEPSDPDLVGCPGVMAMLAAITDVHNLQLAAESNCGYAGGDLPLAKQEELRLALEKLVRIRGLLEEKEKLMKEIETASCDLSDEGFSKRALLIARHETLIEDVSERSSRYYEIMPCQETTLESSIKAFDQASDVNVEITRMRMLSDIVEIYKMILGAKSAVAVRNPLEYCYHSLQVRLAPLQPNDNERQLIHRYFFGGLHMRDRQRYCISNVFEVERRGESERFDDLMKERPDLRATQTHLLWHGTKRTNLLGILSQGLRVAPPEAPHHGYACGKGLYFANVVEKSLGYCGTPYALPVLNKEGNVGENMTKTHEVHYMLLCEVALGKSTELATAAAWTSFDSMHHGRIDSVKALATHLPDPRHEVVSPKCGAKLHLGRVKKVGRELPYDRAWAKTEPTPVPVAWHERDPKFNSLTQDYLARLVADKSFGTGDTHTVSTTGLDRQNFVQYGYRERAVMIGLVSRETLEADRDTDAPCSDAWCEATLKVTIRPNSAMPYSYLVRLYRNVLVTSRLAEGFKLVEPTLSKYAELVVYNEAQARIRYVVEVRMT